MRVEMLKSKIHRARLTDKNLAYEGSLTLDSDLMDAAGIYPYEKVQVVNVNNGSRLETYVIEGRAGSGDVALNGAAARCGEVGDLLILITYAQLEPHELEGYRPIVVHVDEGNRVTSISPTGGPSVLV